MMPKWVRWEIAVVAISIAISLAFAVAMVVIASRRPLSPLEMILFQLIVLLVGLGGGLFGSYKFGQHSAANKQFARSALRSVMVLYRSIAGLHDYIGRRSPTEYERSAILELLVTQMDVAQSAVADWRDIIPENFEDVGESLEQPDVRRSPGNGDQHGTDSG